LPDCTKHSEHLWHRLSRPQVRPPSHPPACGNVTRWEATAEARLSVGRIIGASRRAWMGVSPTRPQPPTRVGLIYRRFVEAPEARTAGEWRGACTATTRFSGLPHTAALCDSARSDAGSEYGPAADSVR
jgi:hypothetical protein